MALDSGRTECSAQLCYLLAVYLWEMYMPQATVSSPVKWEHHGIQLRKLLHGLNETCLAAGTYQTQVKYH